MEVHAPLSTLPNSVLEDTVLKGEDQGILLEVLSTSRALDRGGAKQTPLPFPPHKHTPTTEAGESSEERERELRALLALELRGGCIESVEVKHPRGAPPSARDRLGLSPLKASARCGLSSPLAPSLSGRPVLPRDSEVLWRGVV